MSKKIGLAIATYGSNYGTYLQAFATQYIIRKLGYETEVINIASVRKEVGKARRAYFAKQIFNFSEISSYKHRLYGLVAEHLDPQYKGIIHARKQMCNRFRNQCFVFSEVVDAWKGLADLCQERYSHVVVGSDQLWRPANIAGGFYTLDFVPDNITKIAYATSFGLPSIRKSQCEIAKHFLSRLEYISVRETSGARIVSSLIGRQASVVCDPTMLLSKAEWDVYVSDTPIQSGKYILCYFLGNNKKHRTFAKKLAEQTGCKIVSLLHIAGYVPEDSSFGDIQPSQIGPFEFLNLIKYATYVCTDSFHGCVFASIFERELFAFNRFASNSSMSTNDRITTLLSTLETESCLISGQEDIPECISRQIDRSIVGSNLEHVKHKSLAYLQDALSEKNTL